MTYSLDDASTHLRSADPILARLIDHFGPCDMRPPIGPYPALIRAILHQQVTGKAAASMQRQLFALYSDEGRIPTPEEFLGTSDEQFRSAGISRQKAAYFRDLAQHIIEDKIDFAGFDKLSDEEI